MCRVVYLVFDWRGEVSGQKISLLLKSFVHKSFCRNGVYRMVENLELGRRGLKKVVCSFVIHVVSANRLANVVT